MCIRDSPWLMNFRAISIPEKLERTHLKEWLDHVWIVDFEQVEVILQESEWKGQPFLVFTSAHLFEVGEEVGFLLGLIQETELFIDERLHSDTTDSF